MLGWSAAGLFYSLVILHWAVCAGFDSSLTVPLSGAGLCQDDGDCEARIASLSSLDQLGDLKQVVCSSGLRFVCVPDVTHRLKAELGMEVVLSQAVYTV